MKSKAIVLALLALVVQAQAEVVSQSQAMNAVRAWVAKGKVAKLPSVVRADSYTTPDGRNSLYAVKVGGGVVFTSADTEKETVIAFTSSSVDLSKADRNGPLWALLGRRLAVVGGARDRNVAQWRKLISEGVRLEMASVGGGNNSLFAAEPRALEPEDVRVAPLLNAADDGSTVIRWAQSTTSDGKACWNWYTPNGADPKAFVEGDPNNAVCGCVATAGAQAMRYFRFPTEEIKPKSVTCSYAGKTVSLTMQGGVYDWDAMPGEPNADLENLTDEQRQAIGKLTSDFGIATAMKYESLSGLGSATFLSSAAQAFTDVFGYGNATFFHDGDHLVNGEQGDEARNAALSKALFSNFDAGLPVLVGIPGHAVVADGYGFDSGADFVHLNMGGADETYDLWYNLPNASISGGESGFNDAIYNIFTAEKSDCAVLSGRVLDDGGNPIGGVEVRIFRKGVGGDPVATVQTSEFGVWAAKLPAGYGYAYNAEASIVQTSGNMLMGELENIALYAPMVKRDSFRDADTGEILSIDLVTGDDSERLGNSWGNDIVISEPTVEILRGDPDAQEIIPFASLDKAFAAAEEDDVIMIVRPTTLVHDVVVDRNLFVTSMAEDPYSTPVKRLNGATVTISQGIVFLSDVVFVAEPTTPVFVKGDAILLLNGTVVLDDIVSSVPGVEISTDIPTTGLGVCEELKTAVTVGNQGALNEGDPFGFIMSESPSLIANMQTAAKLVAAWDPSIMGTVDSGDSVAVMYWKRGLAVAPAAAAAYIDKLGETPNEYFRTLDDAFAAVDDRYPDGARIVVTKSGAAMERLWTITKPCTIVSGGQEPLTLNVANGAGFAVAEGGELSVADLRFADYAGNALFLVNGGTLSVADCGFSGIEGTNGWSGAVAVLKGEATVCGTEFSGCRATGKYKATSSVTSNGGALFVANGAKLALSDVSVTGCEANGAGGGIYAESGSRLAIGGVMKVSGNVQNRTVSSAGVPSDICLQDDAVQFVIAAELEPGSTVGVRHVKGAGDEDGSVFVTCEDATADLAKCAKAFFNDCDGDLEAQAVVSGIAWGVAPLKPSHDPLPEEEWDSPKALVRLTNERTGEVSQWENIDWAFEAISVLGISDATVELLQDCSFTENVEVKGKMKLRSASDICDLYQDADVGFVVGSDAALELGNVNLKGSLAASEKPLIAVDGGSLLLDDQSYIFGFHGEGSRCSSAVVVWNGGTFEMRKGALIGWCENATASPDLPSSGAGAAVLVDNGVAYLKGGSISYCNTQSRASGVFIGQKSKVYVSGETTICDNDQKSDSVASNLMVADRSCLILSGELTGQVGFTEGEGADVDVFGIVADDFSGDEAAMARSANRFRHDSNGDVGMIVEKDGSYLLVWSYALAPDGSYTDANGDIYELVPGDGCPIPAPLAIDGLAEDGTDQSGVQQGPGYVLSGDVAAVAGVYRATATLRPGFVWDDGSTDDKTIPWQMSTPQGSLDSTRPVKVTRASDGLVQYYENIGPAFEDMTCDALVELSGDCDFDEDIEVEYNVTVSNDPEGGSLPIVQRTGEGSIKVGKGASLELSNVCIFNSKSYLGRATDPLILVDGGSLALQENTAVGEMQSGETYMANVVTVRNGGTIEMNPGSSISYADNVFYMEEGDGGVCAGLLLEQSQAFLRGGEISNCCAAEGGGVYACSNSTVYVSGPMTIEDNVSLLTGKKSNLIVTKTSNLVLDRPLIGQIGYTEGKGGDPNVFGAVDRNFTGDYDSLTNSAANFSHDLTGAYGLAATNAVNDTTLLVWSSAFDEEGRFVRQEGDETVTYFCVGNIPKKKDPIPVSPDPLTVQSINYDADAQEWVLVGVDATQWCEYSLWGGSVPDPEQMSQITEWKQRLDLTGPITYRCKPENAQGPYYWVIKGRVGYMPVE